MTHDLSHNPKRSRRDTDGVLDSGVPPHYTIEAFGEVFELHMEENSHLFPELRTTRLNENGTDEEIIGSPLCHWHGTVRSHNDSPVALSNCEDGLVSRKQTTVFFY